MKRIYLHIGMGKTGTTALQDFFWDNRQLLAESGICYPEHGIQSNAHHLLSPHIPRFLEGDWAFESVAEWAPRLAELEQDRILLSSELMAWGSPESIREFCEEASGWFDVHVVVYLRRQDNIIMASYNQQIKAGPQKRRIDLIYRNQIARFDYLRILEPWESSLGADKIIVRPYEQKQFYGQDVRRDFMQHVFGLEIDERYEFRSGNSNPRLSLATSEYKRMINNLVTDPQQNARFNQLLMQYSAEHESDSQGVYSEQSVLSPEQRLEILDAARETSEQIARRFLHCEDGRLFRDAEPDPDSPWQGIDLSREDADAITAFLEGEDAKLLAALGREIEEKKNHLAYQIRHSARYLSASVLSTAEATPVYRVAPEDSAPVVIGGLGGSGTRLVISLMRRMGVFVGGEMNESLDNLWFSLLFVRRSILLKSDRDMERLCWIFTNAMRHGVEVSTELREMLDEARNNDRTPVLPPELLEGAVESLLRVPAKDRRHEHWGWKEPNSHILLPQLEQNFPQMRFVYVMRNGLDMAFSENQNQLRYLWGDLLLEGASEPTPANALKYWVAAHRRMMGFQDRLGDRLHFLSFDRLCQDPEGELEALREFVGIPISKKAIVELAATVRAPQTSGRFRGRDLSQFDPEDIAYVQEMGFEVE